MKIKFLHVTTAFAFLLLPNLNIAQAPNLGSASGFVLFSTNGALSNTGISQITGNVGTNNGSSTAFGNVNGVMNDNNGASALCATDVLAAYNQLNALVPTFFPAPLLGNGQTLNAGIYSIAGNASLNLDLILNGQGNPNAVFVIQVQGALSSNASAKVKLINSAKACNVFWKVEGLVSLAAGTNMKGTIIANNSAINISSGDTLEGRALSISGAITIDGSMAYTPIGCGSPVLNGPNAPVLNTAGCFALFSANGPVTNSGISIVTGDIGTNVGLTTGYNSLNVTGNIHPIPDGATGNCATDLLVAYNYLNSLSHDIELLYPAQFGNSLVLTPHVYVLNGLTAFTDTLYLDAGGQNDAVFVIKVNGAFTTSTYAKVLLTNGTQAKNVYWKIDGAVNINDYSDFKGTIICNNGAISLMQGAKLTGGALTTNGSLSSNAVNVTTAPVCGSLPTAINSFDSEISQIIVSPNPFNSSVRFTSTNSSMTNYQVKIFNIVGAEVLSGTINDSALFFETNQLSSGIYIYQIIKSDKIIQSGKLICNQ